LFVLTTLNIIAPALRRITCKGLYALGATCSNPGPAKYLSQYNAHGNVSTRTYNNQDATLSYDPFDQMIEWQVPSGNQAWDAYDAGGTRSLQRTTSGGNTQITVYAFGLDEYHYDGSGNLQNSTHYYTLGGQLIAELSGPPNAETTNFFLTDALGSVLATFSNTAGAASLLGTQLYGPYGNERYQTGSMGTAKGFTGQYADAVTGLDYYGSRYYDPVPGVFLSADSIEGNVAGLNPYGYVGGNPETWTDPTGESYVPPGGGGGGIGGGGGAGGGCNGSCGGSGGGGGYHHTGDGLGTAPTTVPLVIRQAEQIAAQAWDEGGTAAVTDAAEGAEATVTVVCVVVCVIVVAIGSVLLNPTPLASGELSFPIRPPGPTLTNEPGVNSLALGHSMVTPNAPTTPTTQTGSGGAHPPTRPPVATSGGFCSFTPTTPVATAQGEQPIGKLHVGEQVEAYNPKTHKMELEPIEHVWIHNDHDLVDLTLTDSTSKRTQHGIATTKTSETLHTTSEHPFLTQTQGFVPAGKLKLGMDILQADGNAGVVAGWKLVRGTMTMYNLEVAHDHTFAVGAGQWIVHNRCDRGQLRSNLGLQRGDQGVAQHVIPCALENHPLFQASNMDINDAQNGIIMQGDAATAQQAGEIYHSGSHPAYTDAIQSLMDRRLAGLTATDSLNQVNALASVLDTIRDGQYMISAFNEIEATATDIPLRLC
jgi:RHS repeat-associated protein